MEIGLAELEEKSGRLVALFTLRPVPKLAWVLMKELTEATLHDVKNYHSYYMQWCDKFPDSISMEDVAGVDPDIWYFLHKEWVYKSDSKWIDVPNKVHTAIENAAKWSIAWVQEHHEQNGPKFFPRTEGLWIPTVELTEIAETHYYGRLRSLETHFHRLVAPDEGRIVLERVEGNKAEDDIVVQNVCLSSAAWLKKKCGVHKEPDALLRFKDRSGIHVGQSYGLASFVLMSTGMHDLLETSTKFEVNNSLTAFTGLIDDQGYVREVDEEGLIAKVEGCFYSWIQYMVVPASQADICRTKVNQLSKKWPDKSFKIIGIEHAEEIFSDRRLCIIHQKTWIAHTITKLWHNKNSAVGWISFAALVLLSAWLWVRPIDRSPADAFGRGDFIEVENQFGMVVDRIPISKTQIYYHENRMMEQWVLHDVTGDDHKDIIYIAPAENGHNTASNTLVMYDVVQKEVIQKVEIPHMASFPLVEGADNGRIVIVTIRLFNENDDTDLILVTVPGGTFNTMVHRYDLSSGNIIQQYVHPGGVSQIESMDLDGDGKKELLLGGMSNAFYSGVLVILDPDNMSGQGKTQGKYVSTDTTQAQELAYIRIPKSIVGERYHPTKYPFFQSFDMTNFNRNTFSFFIIDFVTNRKDYYEGLDGYYIIQMDTSLQVTSILTSDHYDVIARKLSDEGFITEEPDKAYWEQFVREEWSHWDGREWKKGTGWVRR